MILNKTVCQAAHKGQLNMIMPCGEEYDDCSHKDRGGLNVFLEER